VTVGLAALVACAPWCVLALAVVVELLLISFHRGERAAAAVALIGLGLAGATLAGADGYAPRAVSSLLLIDRYALFYIGVVLVAGAATVALAYGYLADGASGELYLLILLGSLGAAVLAASVHFASFFLGLEILSVSLYALIGYRVVERRGIEAGFKYLVLASVSAAFLLFGMALVYAEAGTLAFGPLAQRIAGGAAMRPAVWLGGVALIVTGIGFKLALVPFHLWTPDVYQGAPAPVSAFVASASKAAVFAVLLRFFSTLHAGAVPSLALAIALIAGFSMFTGNLLALLQTNVKRILAYSSIAHLGYVLVALLARGPLAMEAVGYYLATYAVTMLAAFGVVAALSGGGAEAEELEDYRGLFWRRPWLAATFTTALLSLAAIPVTGGFVAKFYVVAAGASASLWALLIVLAVNSAIGLFYYLRIIVAMYSAPAEPSAAAAAVRLPGGLALAALVAAVLWLGLYPSPLTHLLRVSPATSIALAASTP
jgi:NADH-quinone oxidoreductase subunit N